MENKTVKLTNSKQEVKPLNVTINIVNHRESGTEVDVDIKNPVDNGFLYSETFPMLPNVPLETYVQYTFGKYNALRTDQTKNS